MSKRGGIIPPDLLRLDPESSVPLHRQLYNELRQAILSGRLKGGAGLPSTRLLALQLDVSRATVISAYEQLLAEGYVEGKIGAGTYVARALPDYHSTATVDEPTNPVAEPSERHIARRAAFFQKLALRGGNRHPPASRAFLVGVPAVDMFPMQEWRRITSNRYRRMSTSLLNYGEPTGYAPLREALADYLRTARAVNCSASQVIIVTGSRQALDLTVRMLTDPGDTVWIEDPSYLGIHGALWGNGVVPTGVPVDAEGINIDAVKDTGTQVRLVYVTPSHQFPLGMTMSLSRRLALLEWANRHGAWIIEDDYDGEFRYKGRPLPALQGLDTGNHVIYFGSFSKVLFPSLRLGYLIVPPDLVDLFANAHTLLNWHPSVLDQAVVTDYMTGGYFERHIRRMRTLYAERQAMLLDEIRRTGTPLKITADDAGMHLVGWLPEGIEDRVASRKAAEAGVMTPPLALFRLNPAPAQGLVLGYTATDYPMIHDGAAALTTVLNDLVQNTGG